MRCEMQILFQTQIFDFAMPLCETNSDFVLLTEFVFFD